MAVVVVLVLALVNGPGVWPRNVRDVLHELDDHSVPPFERIIDFEQHL